MLFFINTDYVQPLHLYMWRNYLLNSNEICYMFTKNNIAMNEMNKKSGNDAQSTPCMAGDSNFALYGV